MSSCSTLIHEFSSTGSVSRHLGAFLCALCVSVAPTSSMARIMNILLNFLVFLLVLPSVEVSAAPAVEVWAVPSIQKVRPDDPTESSNLVWSQKTKTVSLAGAKNEHVPFQVVISTPPPATRHDPAASGFYVEVSDLVSSQGRIAKDQVKLFFEHVVLCYAKSSPVGATGFWPDALAPLTNPFSMGAEFRGFVKNRAIWIDIPVPMVVPAGTYSGKVTVTQNGKSLDQLKLSLKVYDFALPLETHLITYMGVSAERLSHFYQVPRHSPELRSILRRYHESLYANRMEPWFNDALQPDVEDSADGEPRVRFDDRVYAYYMNTLKTKRVILEAAPPRARGDSRYPPFSESFNQRAKSYLRQIDEYYKTHGWLERLVINSPIDEPSTVQQFEETRKWAQIVHEAAPGVPFLATKSPVSERPELGPLIGHVNNFSIHGNDLNRLEVKRAIQEEQSKGGEITWYISCDQVYPQPNYFIDAPAMDPVMVPWVTWRYGMNGILYWDLAYWPQTPDPWLNPVTYLSGFLCSGGGVLNGEGSLLYPGLHTHRYTGQDDVDGPVSSLRFELLREGIEDYEYLWLLKSMGDQEFADRVVRDLVVDVSAFSRNVAELFAARDRMAQRIESLVNKK
jgi:hypothetical protein